MQSLPALSSPTCRRQPSNTRVLQNNRIRKVRFLSKNVKAICYISLHIASRASDAVKNKTRCPTVCSLLLVLSTLRANKWKNEWFAPTVPKLWRMVIKRKCKINANKNFLYVHSSDTNIASSLKECCTKTT